MIKSNHQLTLDVLEGKCHVGQLGHGEEFSDEYVPRLVEKPKDVKFVAVSSGDSHSLAITDQGELYVFGIGYYGALVSNTTCLLWQWH